jgi:hypothetical protein
MTTEPNKTTHFVWLSHSKLLRSTGLTYLDSKLSAHTCNNDDNLKGGHEFTVQVFNKLLIFYLCKGKGA